MKRELDKDGIMKIQGNYLYWVDEMPYVKIARDEKIRAGAMHSLHNGHLYPIMNDRETIGQTPDNFTKERDFYNPMV
jgi:hypothetical protein